MFDFYSGVVCAVEIIIKLNLDLLLGRHHVVWSLLMPSVAASCKSHDQKWKPLMFYSALCCWTRVFNMWSELDMQSFTLFPIYTEILREKNSSYVRGIWMIWRVCWGSHEVSGGRGQKGGDRRGQDLFGRERQG